MAEHITVSVDPNDVATRYRSASNPERRKLDLLVNLCLRDATASGKSLQGHHAGNQLQGATSWPDSQKFCSPSWPTNDPLRLRYERDLHSAP